MNASTGIREYAGAALSMLILLLVACNPATNATVALPPATDTPTPPPSIGLYRDAQEYARHFGVPLEEALTRLSYQEPIGELQAVLQVKEADTFGGLWIEHEPAYRIVVAFTRDGEETIRPYLQDQPFAPHVEVRQVRYSLNELEQIVAQTAKELDKLDFDVTYMLDIQENQVEVPVSDRV